MPKFTDNLAAKVNKFLKERKKSLWDGPYQDTDNGGLTYSLLSKFLCCRHRFWLRAVRGLKADEGFQYKMEYGNAWHYCEELLAAGMPVEIILSKLKSYCIELATANRDNKVEINKLYKCICAEFPRYVEYWKENEDVVNRKPVSQEGVFVVSYKLPSGRTVILRGKIDAIDLIDKGLWIQEDKSKSDIPSKEKLKSDLLCDLQSMMYVVAVDELVKKKDASVLGGRHPIKGVRYNIVRRPLSSLKFNIKQKKGRGKAKVGAETEDMFYERLSQLIKDNAKQFFVRMKVEVTREDIDFFKKCILNPILEQLCDWWDSIQGDVMDPWHTTYEKDSKFGPIACMNLLHFIYPSGVYNPVLEGRATNYDGLIYNNDEKGFLRTDTMFPELQIAK